MRVGLDETRAAYLDFLKKRARIADPEDIPGFVRKALGTLDRETGALKGGLFGKWQEINEVLVFRSRLLDELAAARATPGSSGPKRKVLNDLQGAIIDKDLTALAGQVDEEVRASVDLAIQVIAIELLVMAEAIEYQRPLRSGEGVERAFALVRSVVPRLTEDRPPAPDIAAIAQLIRSGAFARSEA